MKKLVVLSMAVTIFVFKTSASVMITVANNSTEDMTFDFYVKTAHIKAGKSATVDLEAAPCAILTMYPPVVVNLMNMTETEASASQLADQLADSKYYKISNPEHGKTYTFSQPESVEMDSSLWGGEGSVSIIKAGDFYEFDGGDITEIREECKERAFGIVVQ